MLNNVNNKLMPLLEHVKSPIKCSKTLDTGMQISTEVFDQEQTTKNKKVLQNVAKLWTQAYRHVLKYNYK